MLFKKSPLIFVLIISVFTLLTYQGIKDRSLVSDLPSYPLKILTQGGTAVIRGVKNIVNTYILIIGKEEENQRLMKELNILQQERNQYLETRRENERLRRLLKLKSRRTDFVTAAEVFAREPTNWFQVLWINKGERDGISKDMVAVTPSGIVGRIGEVFDDKASIILVTDVNSSIAVRVQSTRIEGILEGRGNNSCYLKYIPYEADAEVGDRIITSGLDGIWPEGLLVGQIVNIEKRPGTFFQQIEVIPAQNLNAIEEVVILKR